MSNPDKFLKPFAQYRDWNHCIASNKHKKDASAYCGRIKSLTEDKKHKAVDLDALSQSLQGLSSLDVSDAEKAQIRGQIVDAARTAGARADPRRVTAASLAVMDNRQLWLTKLALNASRLTRDVLLAHMVLQQEMKTRGIIKTLGTKLEKETEFWLKAKPPTHSEPVKLIDIWGRMPPAITKESTVYMTGAVVSTGVAGPHNTIDLHIRSAYDGELKREIIHGVIGNDIRDKLRFTWDTEPPSGTYVKLYDAVGRWDFTQTFRPLSERKMFQHDSAMSLWHSVSGDKTPLLIPRYIGPDMEIHKRGDIVKVYIDGRLMRFPEVAEHAKSLKASSAVIFAEAVTVEPLLLSLYDVYMVNGEQVPHTVEYQDKLTKAKALIDEVDGWMIPDFYSISTKAGFDTAIRKSLELEHVEGVAVQGYITSYMSKDADCSCTLKRCAYGNDEDTCPLKKADVEYPVECSLANSYRCTYVKSIYYEEAHR